MRIHQQHATSWTAMLALGLAACSGAPRDVSQRVEPLGSQVESVAAADGSRAVTGELELRFDLVGSDVDMGEAAELRLVAVYLSHDYVDVTPMDQGHTDPRTPLTHVIGQPTELTVLFQGHVESHEWLCQADIEWVLYDDYSDQLGTHLLSVSSGSAAPSCPP